ncbi:MAG TPA: hypothetical protein VF622_14565 [Segetibacter sp.]|jgi:hypothetical protein
MNRREAIIANYIEGYNQFDIKKMLQDFEDAIEFKNITNGEVNMTLSGIASFKEQAEKAKAYFSSRKQIIKSFEHRDDETVVEVDYHAVLAIDFANELKGAELKIRGKSIFNFSNDKIIKLTDIS